MNYHGTFREAQSIWFAHFSSEWSRSTSSALGRGNRWGATFGTRALSVITCTILRSVNRRILLYCTNNNNVCKRSFFVLCVCVCILHVYTHSIFALTYVYYTCVRTDILNRALHIGARARLLRTSHHRDAGGGSKYEIRWVLLYFAIKRRFGGTSLSSSSPGGYRSTFRGIGGGVGGKNLRPRWRRDPTSDSALPAERFFCRTFSAAFAFGVSQRRQVDAGDTRLASKLIRVLVAVAPTWRDHIDLPANDKRQNSRLRSLKLNTDRYTYCSEYSMIACFAWIPAVVEVLKKRVRFSHIQTVDVCVVFSTQHGIF